MDKINIFDNFSKKAVPKRVQRKDFFSKSKVQGKTKKHIQNGNVFFLILERCELRRLRSSYIVNELPSFARFVKQFFLPQFHYRRRRI